MASRNPRAGSSRDCGGLTKTQQLRQARSVAAVREYEQKEEAAKHRLESGMTRRRRSTYEPKKVDFSKPSLTKAMLARVKHAEKFKQEYERKKEEEILPDRRPKKTPAPIGGDARLGRERRTGTFSSPPTSPPRAAPTSRVQSSIPRRSAAPRLGRQAGGLTAIPERTCELAKSMNADIVQAEPIGDGPIESIVIPPGALSDDRTTVVAIPQAAAAVETSAVSQIANRSIQVISETLDEQDAVEASAVQCKLMELQQARRDFVISIANVGGNSVNIGEGMAYVPSQATPQSSPMKYYKSPDIEEEKNRIMAAAREAAQRTLARMREREEAMRMQHGLGRLLQEEQLDDLDLETPPEEELIHLEDSYLDDDEEPGMQLHCPSRLKATLPRVSKREEPYLHKPFDPDELERFFDVERYPPSPAYGAPPGREDLHPDLWELEDPWYRPPPCPADMPDLIEFDSH